MFLEFNNRAGHEDEPTEAAILQVKLIHAVTAYDQKQESKKSHNPYALSLYFQAVEDAMIDIRDGFSIRDSLCNSFNDRLLDVVLKAAGLPKATLDEIRGIK